VQTDTAAVAGLIRGKRVLVTGGGGSIGGELCRQILRCCPIELVLLGHGENSIFSIYHDLLALPGQETEIFPIIADIRFQERLHSIMQSYRPQLVFHAAAHKHVPLMEVNPGEAITNNVLGTRNLLAEAQAAGVERFVMISTDKAVNPTSVMGASKRVAELLVHEAARASGKPYVTVRFGNVLGSRGSVVQTFKRQIARGGPITVTDPAMTRYFMTIPEAVQLVLQAAVLGQGGETFVLDMGEPVKIVDLARDLIELSGLQVGRDIDITFVGTRPGEKLFEELFVEGESHHRTQHEKIFIADNDSISKMRKPETLVEALIVAAQNNDEQALHSCLQAIIPDYRSMSALSPAPSTVEETIGMDGEPA
jgi:FlaA1/EpsC-like NDP-sugar epimerase